ncbi:hypothetical protein DL93DRAFT_35042 [Clavulina sp. PMI_390]|nr:hypothetical protein DL93DRAFT_35042 [Clavulina sp. PMI_390]
MTLDSKLSQNPVDPKMVDDFIADWRGQRIHACALLTPIMYFTTGMTPDEAALVKCLILVAQGDLNHLFTPESAHNFVAHYPNAQSSVHILPGGPPATSVSPEFAPTLHRLIVSNVEHSMLISESPNTATFSKPLPPISGKHAMSVSERRDKGMREAMSILSCPSHIDPRTN